MTGPRRGWLPALAAVAAALAWLATGLAPRTDALRPAGVSSEDRRRFGLNRLGRRERRGPRPAAQRAFGDFSRKEGRSWKARFNPRTGTIEALTAGSAAPRRGGHRAAAESFLRETRGLTNVEPSDLTLDRQNFGKGMSHLLYRQAYKGVPVEFSRVKVHVDDHGRVIGLNSSFEPDLAMGLEPSLNADAAFASVRAELGPLERSGGSIVIFPSEMSGRSHLAWKFTVRQGWRLWRYYVDAHTGQVLFRYDDHRYQACVTSGTVTAHIAEIDPSQTPYQWKPLKHQRVYVKDGSHYADTNAQGFFCSDTKGKIATSVQGPYANVSNFRGPSAHYDNGSGAWSTIATQKSSPHPYPNGTTLVETITLAASLNAVKVLPVFSQFSVGSWDIIDAQGTVVDNDQLFILDSAGNPVASYIGNRGPFNGAAVHGRTYSIALKSNESGQQHGYDINFSSYLVLSAADEWNVNGSSLAWWPSSHTALNLGGEFSAFYHVNAQHDYFVGGVNKSSIAFLGVPLNVNVYVGPDLVSPFYDPDMDNLMLSDIDSASPRLASTDDATAVRHEYTHYVQERIFSSPYFGQSGAIQEALAYYYAASALNHSTSGLWFNRILNPTVPNPSPVMELACPPNCKVLSTTGWIGEVHDDSAFIGQAFWSIRKKVIDDLSLPAACADGLIFESLLFFPESFAEFYDALLRVDAAGTVAACGGANTVGGIITVAFDDHGLPAPRGDDWERNDGFMTAVDISTLSSLSATVYPASDVDTYSFGAGPGRLRIKMALPASGAFFKAYAIRLFDSQQREIARAQPALNGFNTVDGQYCETFDCTTTEDTVTLDHSITEGGLYFIQVTGAESEGFSNSGVASATPYVLTNDIPRAKALDASIVSAVVDNDLISFDVTVTTYANIQPYRFAYAQLRNHALEVIPNTLAIPGSAASTYLSWVSSHNALGSVSGQVRLNGSFGARFPAVGTIHLEVFGYNVLGSTISLGLSGPMNLSSNRSKLTVFNNVFKPLQGGKVTIKFEVPAAGRVTLRLYALDGTLVATLFDDSTSGGKGSLDWSGRNMNGMGVASGIYLLKLSAAGVQQTQKIVVVK
ncbi:MAG: T9SS type A sorting domain-containing protein [Elusimicrobia bacterium]|nr:T9SS type A sorting domain-containing protein [Elusimicrobiota bacterium]